MVADSGPVRQGRGVAAAVLPYTDFIYGHGAGGTVPRAGPAVATGRGPGPRAARRRGAGPGGVLYPVRQRRAHLRRPANGADADGARSRDRRPGGGVRPGRPAGRPARGGAGRGRPRDVVRDRRLWPVFLLRRRSEERRVGKGGRGRWASVQ